MPFVLLYVVLEIVALAGLIAWIGLGWTLLVLLTGSVIGLLLARREGVRAARALATAVQRGKLAHEEATDGLLVAAGGILIFLPGLITDVLGLALVFPPTRALVRRRMVNAAERAAPSLRTARIRYGATVVEGRPSPSRARRPRTRASPVPPRAPARSSTARSWTAPTAPDPSPGPAMSDRPAHRTRCPAPRAEGATAAPGVRRPGAAGPGRGGGRRGRSGSPPPSFSPAGARSCEQAAQALQPSATQRDRLHPQRRVMHPVGAVPSAVSAHSALLPGVVTCDRVVHASECCWSTAVAEGRRVRATGS
nr:FxsA family protein [Pseudonocardia sp. AL041005-10]